MILSIIIYFIILTLEDKFIVLLYANVIIIKMIKIIKLKTCFLKKKNIMLHNYIVSPIMKVCKYYVTSISDCFNFSNSCKRAFAVLK